MGALYDDSGIDILEMGPDDIATKKAHNMVQSRKKVAPLARNAGVVGPYEHNSDQLKVRRKGSQF